jgi:hypothetical protein
LVWYANISISTGISNCFNSSMVGTVKNMGQTGNNRKFYANSTQTI